MAVSTHASTPRFTTVPFVPPTTPEVETTTEDNYVIDGCPVTSSQLNDIEMVDYEERIVSTANGKGDNPEYIITPVWYF